MRWIYFFSRVVFICNLFYLLAIYIRLNPTFPDIFLSSTSIIIGTIMAIYGNIFINLAYLILLFNRKKMKEFAPVWLVLANFIFLLIQITLYFVL